MQKLWTSIILALTMSIIAVTPALAQEGGEVRFGRNIEVTDDEVVDGDLVVVGGNIFVAGQVLGDVVAVGGNVDVSGDVVGDVVSIGGVAHLGPTASVSGDLVIVGGSLDREEGAEVGGTFVETGPDFIGIPGWQFWSFDHGIDRGPPDGMGIVFRIISSLMAAFGLVAVAVLAAAIFPTQLAVVRQTIEAVPLQVFGVGVLSIIVAVAISPILFFTCIGLPIFWLVVALASLFGTVGLASLAGERLLLAFNVRDFTTIAAAVVGILAIWAGSWLPGLGLIFMIFVFFFGLGAVVLSRFGTIAPPFSWQTRTTPRSRE